MVNPQIAIILRLNPNKLGSLEEWMIAFAREASARNLKVDFFTGPDNLPEILVELNALGAGWFDLEQASKTPVAFILRLSKYKVIHLNLYGVRDRISLLAYLALPSKIVFVDHLSKSAEIDVARRNFVKKLADRFSSLRISCLIGVSEFITNYNWQRFGRRAKCVTVHNGVNTVRFTPNSPQQKTPLRIVTTAHLIPEKGIAILLQAFAQITNKDATLAIVGTGSELDALKRLSTALNLESRVEFLGLRNDVNKVLQSGHIFVHPALWNEAFGLGIAEAMACGLPVIASNCGGIPEIIEDGISGILTKPGDASTLVQALNRLIADSDLRQSLGNRARARMVERFGLLECVKQHIDWCERVIDL